MSAFDNATLMINGDSYSGHVFSHMAVLLKYASSPW